MSEKLIETIFKSQNGNEQAYESLYIKYKPRIVNLSKKLFYEEAETDLIIFLLKTVKKLKISKFKNRSNEEIDSYINTALKNECFTLMKKSMKSKKSTVEYNDYVIDEHHYDKYSKLENTDMEKCLVNLSEMQKKIVIEKIVNETSDTKLAIFLMYQDKRYISKRKRHIKYLD